MARCTGKGSSPSPATSVTSHNKPSILSWSNPWRKETEVTMCVTAPRSGEGTWTLSNMAVAAKKLQNCKIWMRVNPASGRTVSRWLRDYLPSLNKHKLEPQCFRTDQSESCQSRPVKWELMVCDSSLICSGSLADGGLLLFFSAFLIHHGQRSCTMFWKHRWDNSF